MEKYLNVCFFFTLPKMMSLSECHCATSPFMSVGQVSVSSCKRGYETHYLKTGMFFGCGMVMLAGQPLVEVGRSSGVRPIPVAPKYSPRANIVPSSMEAQDPWG